MIWLLIQSNKLIKIRIDYYSKTVTTTLKNPIYTSDANNNGFKCTSGVIDLTKRTVFFSKIESCFYTAIVYIVNDRIFLANMSDYMRLVHQMLYM